MSEQVLLPAAGNCQQLCVEERVISTHTQLDNPLETKLYLSGTLFSDRVYTQQYCFTSFRLTPIPTLCHTSLKIKMKK